MYLGRRRPSPQQALLELDDAVVCAVPFLRERYVRQAAPGQSFDESRSGHPSRDRQPLSPDFSP